MSLRVGPHGYRRAVRPLLTCGLITAVACRVDARTPVESRSARAPHAGSTEDFAQIFREIAHISLAESEDVINVALVVQADPEGGFLVADRGEQQIRRYSDEGGLVWYFGRLGQGPEEFESPNAVTRLNANHILAVDRSGKTLVWDEATHSVSLVGTARFVTLDDVDVLTPRTALYSTRAWSVRNTLHVVDLVSGKTLRSFFRPSINKMNDPLVQMAGWTVSDIRHDTIASVFALSDTIYLHDIHGTLLAEMPFPTSNFVRVTTAFTGKGRLFDWAWRHSLVSGVHWLPNGDVVVEYQELFNNMPAFRLLGVARSGAKLFEVWDTPRLYDIDEKGRFLFDDPTSDLPNHLLLAEVAP